LPVRSDWRKISAIGAVALWLDDEESLQTKMFFRLYPDENITSHLIRDFLHQVRLQLDGQMTVLWDRASVHTANRIERFFETYDRLDEIRIPTCCPELNPCEGVWDWSKITDMGNVTPQTFDDLISRTRSSLTKLQHRDHVHRWCHHQAEIDLLS
jgi:transposase